MYPVSSSDRQPGLSYTPGDVIGGKYALEELLGEGGMGAVFRARNTAIDMPVALKLIRADLDRELLSGRLLQEARAAAKLAHPAIVRVFDVGETELGDPFIVMELLHGETLAMLLEREGRLSSARAVQLLLPIADALSVAHAKGFVHRDVKPDNVFITNDDEGQLQPKLVDFGIVKHELQEGVSQLTQLGAVLGSPDYMSPEQARGLAHIDLRSDVWSFSIMLYEVITGATPFQAENYNALLRLIVEAEPLSLREQSAADAELSQIVQCGLSKNPADRFATMGLMGKALATWLNAQGVSEDACGVSLEARWLSRSADPAALGRVARSSAPDSWPEPPSGVRAVSGNLGHAPTVPLPRQAGTPYSLATSSHELPERQRYWLLGSAALAIVVALALGYFGVVRASAPVSASASVSLQQPPPKPAALSVAREPVVAPPALGSSAASANAVAATAKPILRPTTPKPSAQEPTGEQPTGEQPTGEQPTGEQPETDGAAPRESDLLAPY